MHCRAIFRFVKYFSVLMLMGLIYNSVDCNSHSYNSILQASNLKTFKLFWTQFLAKIIFIKKIALPTKIYCVRWHSSVSEAKAKLPNGT